MHAVGIAHEAGDERIARLLVELARRAFLRDDRPVHHDDAVRHRHRFRLVMGDVDDREVQALLQLADLLAHLPAQARVEVRQRLVEQQHRGLQHQRPRDGDALLLAAGELGGEPGVEAGQADRRQRGARLVVGLRLALPRDDEAVAHVFQHAHVRKQRIALEHHRHVAPGGGARGHVLVADQDGAGGGQLEPGQHPQDRRLAAAGGAEQRHQGSRADGERDVVDGDDVAVALGHLPEFDRCGFHLLSPTWCGIRRRCRRARRCPRCPRRRRAGRAGARRRATGSRRSRPASARSAPSCRRSRRRNRR